MKALFVETKAFFKTIHTECQRCSGSSGSCYRPFVERFRAKAKSLARQEEAMQCTKSEKSLYRSLRVQILPLLEGDFEGNAALSNYVDTPLSEPYRPAPKPKPKPSAKKAAKSTSPSTTPSAAVSIIL